MKKIIAYFFFIALLVFTASCGSEREENGSLYPEDDPPSYITDQYPETPDPEPIPLDIPPYNEYIVWLQIDPQTNTVEGISQVLYTNRTGAPLDEIVFRLYLNAFREDHLPLPFFEELKERVFRRGIDFGYMNISYAFLDNDELEYTLDGTVLTLHLPEPLMPDVTVRLILQYHAYIPQIAHRTGANQNAMWFGKFLPILAFFDEDGWRKDNYYPAGDPFIMETANFRVDIITPIRYMVVGTGHRTEEVIGETDTKVTTFVAHQVRDFSFALSPEFNHAYTMTYSGIDIHLYYFTPGFQSDEVLNFSRFAMEYFENRVGTFPFSHVTIVEAELMTDSASFSQMVLIDGSPIAQGNFWGLAHGLGDQWFANVIGADRIRYPWLDEGLTRFVQAGIFFRTPEDLRERMKQERATIEHRSDLYLTTHLGEYTNWSHYVFAQGRKAMLMFYSLSHRMGYDNFWHLINRYYHQFSFQIATGADFFALAEEIYEDSLEDFIDDWVRSGRVPELPELPD